MTEKKVPIGPGTRYLVEMAVDLAKRNRWEDLARANGQIQQDCRAAGTGPARPSERPSDIPSPECAKSAR